MTPTERDDACAAAAGALRRPLSPDAPTLVAGFDGFIDRVIDVVSERTSPDAYSRVPTLASLGARISDAAGRSANLELVVKDTKPGGNGAILAAAAGALGARTVFVGTIGAGAPDPLFAPLSAGANRAVAIAPPGKTEALEFDDGKLLLGEPATLRAVTWDAVAPTLAEAVPSALLAMGNWTMTPDMTDIWRRLASDILPGAACAGVFIDLADPAKRTDNDLRDALDAMRAMDAHAPLTLGLNVAEGERLAGLLGIQSSATDLAAAAAALRERTGLSAVALHTRPAAALATSDGAWAIDGPFLRHPAATTGAGDHFNAGVCVGAALGLAPPARLALGVGCSGLFVRTGRSPERSALAEFLEDLPAPE